MPAWFSAIGNAVSEPPPCSGPSLAAIEKVEAFRVGLGPWLAQHCPEALGFDDQAATLAEGLRARLTIALKELARRVAV